MNTELEDKLSQPHYFRYVNYKKIFSRRLQKCKRNWTFQNVMYHLEHSKESYSYTMTCAAIKSVIIR